MHGGFAEAGYRLELAAAQVADDGVVLPDGDKQRQHAGCDQRQPEISGRLRPHGGLDALHPAQPLEEREDLDRLRRAILDLRSEEKEVFLLRQNGGLTYEQIAEIRNSPVGTVKTQMRAALQKLRKILN